MDENKHNNYVVSCELGRYDTLLHGQRVPKPTLVVRFNPHNTSTITIPFLDRLKLLVQNLRREFARVLPKEELPIVTVQYLFYGVVFMIALN